MGRSSDLIESSPAVSAVLTVLSTHHLDILPSHFQKHSKTALILIEVNSFCSLAVSRCDWRLSDDYYET